MKYRYSPIPMRRCDVFDIHGDPKLPGRSRIPIDTCICEVEEFIKNENGELMWGIPSSEIVWKTYVRNNASLNANALMASAII